MTGQARLRTPLVTSVLLCATWLPPMAIAQAPPASDALRRWAVSVYLGASAGGPARDLEVAMSGGGYTEPFGGCTPFFGCVPESPSPASYSHHNPWLLSIRYRARGAYGAELLLGQTSTGTTSGRRQGQTLDIEYGGTVVAPLASIGTPHLRAGIGPALLQSRWNYRDSGDGSQDRVTRNTLGWIGNAALGLPIGASFEAGVTGQYRGFGATTVGPSPSGAPTLGAASVRTAHWYAAGGVGVRF